MPILAKAVSLFTNAFEYLQAIRTTYSNALYYATHILNSSCQES